MVNDFKLLADFIKKHSSGKKIIYIPNPGNYGDGLIRYATKKFFNDYNIEHWEVNVGYGMIKYQLLPYLLNHKKHFFIYGGGGGWCAAYDCGYRVCKAISMFTNNLMVLPSTFDLDLKSIKGHLFRRDNFNSYNRAPSSLFCHDMAFYLTCKPLGIHFDVQNSKKVKGLLMRTDREKATDCDSYTSRNIDLSTKGNHMSNGDEFLRLISLYDEIHTDRLHICIAAIVLGIKVNLYPGNYFKIKAIYDSSISTNFSNVILNDVCNSVSDLELKVYGS